jgi:hypothetical protein
MKIIASHKLNEGWPRLKMFYVRNVFFFCETKKILSRVGREGAETASWDLANIQVFHIFTVDIGSPVFSIIILWLQSTGKEKREEEVGCIMGESKTEKIKI